LLKFWCHSRFFCWAIMLLYTYVEFLHCRASYAWKLSSCVTEKQFSQGRTLLWSFRRGMPSWSCTHSIYWVFIQQTMISVQCACAARCFPLPLWQMPRGCKKFQASLPEWLWMQKTLKPYSFPVQFLLSSLTKYVDHFCSWMGFLRTILSMISRCMFAIYLKRKNNGAFPIYSFYLFGKLSSLQIRRCNEEVWTLFCLL
jgi:hypothetical protein